MAGIKTRIYLRNDELSSWNESTVQLKNGEVALARLSGELSDKYEIRIGVGDKTWNQLSSSSLILPIENISGLSDAIENAINGLSIEPFDVGAGKTILSIGQVNGKIQVEATDISIAQSQVGGLSESLGAKLDKTEFSTLSNEIGLSSASSSNPVVTSSDISGITGAMHFKGVISKQGSESDLCAISAYYDDVLHADPVDGDMVIIQDTAFEYVYGNSIWHKLGDESTYVSKAEYNEQVGVLTTNDAFLSSNIDNKIFIDGQQAKSLCAIHISQDDFYQKVLAGEILSNELYIVSSENINAYGQYVQNVHEPTLSSDAATKNYVDSSISALAGNSLSGVSLNGQNFTVVDNVASLSIEEISCGNASA